MSSSLSSTIAGVWVEVASGGAITVGAGKIDVEAGGAGTIEIEACGAGTIYVEADRKKLHNFSNPSLIALVI